MAFWSKIYSNKFVGNVSVGVCGGRDNGRANLRFRSRSTTAQMQLLQAISY